MPATLPADTTAAFAHIVTRDRKNVNVAWLDDVMFIDFSRLSLPSGRMPTLSEAEEFLIKAALRESAGNQRAAALMLGISRQALNKRLQRDISYLEAQRT